MTVAAAAPKIEPAAPWERQNDESDAAWQAFTVYRDLGLQRTYAATAAKCRKHVSLVQRWSLVRNWKIRTIAWDRDLDRARFDAHKQALRAMESRHSEIAATMIGRLKERLGQLAMEDLAEMAPRDLALWLKLAVDIERRSRGADLFLKPQSMHCNLDDDDDAWVLQNFDINDLRSATKE